MQQDMLDKIIDFSFGSDQKLTLEQAAGLYRCYIETGDRETEETFVYGFVRARLLELASGTPPGKILTYGSIHSSQFYDVVMRHPIVLPEGCKVTDDVRASFQAYNELVAKALFKDYKLILFTGARRDGFLFWASDSKELEQMGAEVEFLIWEDNPIAAYHPSQEICDRLSHLNPEDYDAVVLINEDGAGQILAPYMPPELRNKALIISTDQLDVKTRGIYERHGITRFATRPESPKYLVEILRGN